MLTQIKLTNFKCFKEETIFPLGQLNLLTGINGRGKSTLLQSLLLMQQSIEHNEKTTQILLNGSCVNLGNFDDVRNKSISKSEPIVFEYDFSCNSNYENVNLKYYLKEDKEDNMVLNIEKFSFSYKEYEELEWHSEELNKIEGNRYLPIGTDTENNLGKYLEQLVVGELQVWTDVQYFYKIHYISADRFGPQDFYLKSNLTSFPNVGIRGEFTANILDKKKDYLVDDKLCLGEDAKTLITQTEAWLNEIFDGGKIEVSSSRTNILELLFNTSSTSKDRFKSSNVGFGYSYILPIIVSGLIAKKGEILIIENPEAHLHPKAQSRLAQFLAKVSSCGVQVFIESHSDHILNALRIAVLDKIVTPEEVSILYFQQTEQQPVPIQIPIKENGGIEEWPEGFFDQMDKDFERIFGI
ncbi:DUF3696 domain-containing protein [Candidatus Halobeggiatoa sp. HSG11]|nr:DUF3696 domain-containing protein [Candidatus Halobeggiatoa sp. HSG11]